MKKYFKVGMDVYSARHEAGQIPGKVIDIIRSETEEYPIVVQFGDDKLRITKRYTTEGKDAYCDYVVLSQNRLPLIENEPIVEIGDIGYFWDNDCTKNVRYGRLFSVKDGKYLGWNSMVEWDNFSTTPPEIAE